MKNHHWLIIIGLVWPIWGPKDGLVGLWDGDFLVIAAWFAVAAVSYFFEETKGGRELKKKEKKKEKEEK